MRPLRERIVDLYDRYDNVASATYERAFNSILDTEDDPNPDVADDDRDRWLIERTWVSAISAVLDMMPQESEDGHRAALEVADRQAAQAEEVARLREIVKEAWRLWADITGGRPIYPQLDGGFAVVRVSPERLAAFDALFRTSAADAGAPAVAPAGADAGDGDGER